MKKWLGITALYLLLSCQTETPYPGEVKATLWGPANLFEYLFAYCGDFWKVRVDGHSFNIQTTDIPAGFKESPLEVWVRYKVDSSTNGQRCHFVKFISIRKQ